MAIKTSRFLLPLLLIILIIILACNLPSASSTPLPPTAEAQQPTAATEPPTLIAYTPTIEIKHNVTPGDVSAGKLVYDVTSEDTAPEERAPYGDSYDINRLERPFLQNMTYVPDLDIVTYTVSQDDIWWYVSVQLVGQNPNNSLGIDYGVALDKDHDGFGDYIIWSHPPYTPVWDTSNVQIYQDTNHDTSGFSADKSDAPITTNGYDKLIFNGGNGDADPDLAWMRVNAGFQATVQFAFKKSWSGNVFMLGVIADAGLKDMSKLDYVDRFTEQEAGSPVRDKINYPLKALYAVDNTCREAFGFKPTGYEPQLCPHDNPPPPRKKTPETPGVCQPPPYCVSPDWMWYQNGCYCVQVPF